MFSLMCDYCDLEKVIENLFRFQDENSLVHGEDFKEAVESIWDRVADKQNVLAIGVNCLDPKVSGELRGIELNLIKKCFISSSARDAFVGQN